MSIRGDNATLAKTSPSKIDERWGAGVTAHGWLALPILLIDRQAALGLTATEFAVLVHILRHWWAADQLPFPGNKSLANKLGFNARQVQRHIASLERKGFVQRQSRKSEIGAQTSNWLDPAGLVSRLLQLEATLPTKADRLEAGQNSTASATLTSADSNEA